MLELTLLIIGMVAGTLGSMLGVGGGFLIVPTLVLIGLPMHSAVSTSLASTIMTSVASSSVYSERGLVDFKIGLLLEIFAAAGAVGGAHLAIYLPENVLEVMFGFILLYVSLKMFRKQVHIKERGLRRRCLLLVPLFAFLAGMASGMLGIGGGTLKVPLMVLILNIPTRIAIATSVFMVGITASSGAIVYWFKGLLNPYVVAPIAVGIFLGSRVGTRLSLRSGELTLRRAFGLLLTFIAVRMLFKGLGVWV